MKTAKVTLAGKLYTVTELPRRKSAAWRERLAESMTGLVQLLEAAPAAMGAANAANMRGLLPAATLATQQVLGSIDTAYELLLEYAPELARDKERLDDEAYDSEIVEAFMAILGLAYPFGAAAGRILALSSNGATAPLT